MSGQQYKYTFYYLLIWWNLVIQLHSKYELEHVSVSQLYLTSSPTFFLPFLPSHLFLSSFPSSLAFPSSSPFPSPIPLFSPLFSCHTPLLLLTPSFPSFTSPHPLPLASTLLPLLPLVPISLLPPSFPSRLSSPHLPLFSLTPPPPCPLSPHSSPSSPYPLAPNPPTLFSITPPPPPLIPLLPTPPTLFPLFSITPNLPPPPTPSLSTLLLPLTPTLLFPPAEVQRTVKEIRENTKSILKTQKQLEAKLKKGKNASGGQSAMFYICLVHTSIYQLSPSLCSWHFSKYTEWILTSVPVNVHAYHISCIRNHHSNCKWQLSLY